MPSVKFGLDCIVLTGVKAAQKLELLALFEQVSNGNINHQDSSYEIYLSLRKFVFLAQKFSIHECEIRQFTIISDKLFEYWTEVFKNQPFPKLHIMRHYEDLTRKYGPLAYFSTMKIECKHLVFKTYAWVMNNYRNPTEKFAVRHQLSNAFYNIHNNSADINFFEEELSIQSVIEHALPTSAKKMLMKNFYSFCHRRYVV